MNNFTKTLLFGIGLVIGTVSLSHAAAAVRGGKPYKSINFSATAVIACKGPAVLYSVVSSTGATSDYVVFRDSATANTSSTPVVRVGLATTGVTNVTFDPPIQFVNGISVNAPAGVEIVSVTCESGRITQGY